MKDRMTITPSTGILSQKQVYGVAAEATPSQASQEAKKRAAAKLRKQQLENIRIANEGR